uniref:Secreted protein n=1 Tax=Romanomermis culicivorax TaxID=13658 RepID=A0A915JGR4_ROMCU
MCAGVKASVGESFVLLYCHSSYVLSVASPWTVEKLKHDGITTWRRAAPQKLQKPIHTSNAAPLLSMDRTTGAARCLLT